MPGLTWVQSNVAYYGVSGSGGNLPCAFASNNTQGNIGIAWISQDSSTPSSGVTDTNGNVWYQFPGYYSNFGNSEVWVCPILKPGPNTVTASGLSLAFPGISPELVLLEYAPVGCAPCNVGIQCFVATHGPNGYFAYGMSSPALTIESRYNASGGAYYQTLVAFIKAQKWATTATARTWSVGLYPTYYVGNVPAVRQTYLDPTTLETGAVADCTVPYPHADNFITFSYSPGSPAVNSEETVLIGLLISTLS